MPSARTFIVQSFVLTMLASSCTFDSGTSSLVHSGATVPIATTESTSGVYVGSLSKDSKTAQQLVVDLGDEAPLVGVRIEPGSLGIDTEVSVQLGASIANDLTAASLNTPPLSPAGAAVTISAADGVELSTPGTLVLSLNGTGLSLLESESEIVDRLVIVFKVKHANGDVRLGLIPRSSLTVDGSTVSFPFRYFGSYQPALVPEGSASAVANPIDVASPTPILTRNDETNAKDQVPVVSAISVARVNDATATFVADVTSVNALVGCAAVFDRDKSLPWDGRASAQSSSSLSFTALEKGIYQARFICIDALGLTSVASEWSEGIELDPSAPEADSLKSIAITQSTVALALGMTLQLKVNGTSHAGVLTDLTSKVTWSSISPNLVNVSATGIVEALGVGTSVVEASLGELRASVGVNVDSAPLMGLQIMPIDPTIAYRNMLELTAVIVSPDGTSRDVSNEVEWSSSDFAVRVSNAWPTIGTVQGIAAGDADVRATLAGVTVSTRVTVERTTPTCVRNLNSTPKVICTFADLMALPQGFQEVRLGQDIDASGAQLEPLVDYHGTFDGDDHYITGLNIVTGSHNSVGLFTSISQNPATVVKNLHLRDINYQVTSSVARVGGLVGYTSTWLDVDNVTVTGTISCSNCADIGGLAGITDGGGAIVRALTDVELTGSSVRAGGLLGGATNVTVTDSVAYGDVPHSTFASGGLLGIAGWQASVTNSSAHGNVLGSEQYAGGLIGYMDNSDPNVVVDRCFATGSVGNALNAGGLLGATGSDVSNSYATGSVGGASTQSAGGLIGITFGSNSHPITNSFATGNVQASASAGGLVGTLDVNYAIVESFSTSAMASTILGQVGLVSGTVQGGLVGTLILGTVDGTKSAYLQPAGSTLPCVGSAMQTCTKKFSIAEMADPSSVPLLAFLDSTIWWQPDATKLPRLQYTPLPYP